MEQWGILWTNLDNSRDSAQWRKVWALVLVGATRCWRRCESRGFFYVCVKVVRAYPVSPCFTCSSIGQEPDCCWLVVGGFGLGFVVCVVCCLCCFVFSAPGLSFWSSCLTMTTLAQLHDCHSCNDERSNVQKKTAAKPEKNSIHDLSPKNIVNSKPSRSVIQNWKSVFTFHHILCHVACLPPAAKVATFCTIAAEFVLEIWLMTSSAPARDSEHRITVRHLLTDKATN